jgi:hypothetical protein
MNWKPLAIVPLSFATLLSFTACRIETNKSENGKDKNVKIDTPFGGLHVSTDKTNAADVGLPLYPKAQPVHEDGDSNSSADIHMGFGKWQMRVKVVEYTSPDAEDDVTAFYKKALGRYGDVITCKGDIPVGTPTITREGLTCKGSGKDGPNAQININERLVLKAGSPTHQHLVSIKNPENHQTRFALIALDLPRDLDKTEETN